MGSCMVAIFCNRKLEYSGVNRGEGEPPRVALSRKEKKFLWLNLSLIHI